MNVFMNEGRTTQAVAGLAIKIFKIQKPVNIVSRCEFTDMKICFVIINPHR